MTERPDVTAFAEQNNKLNDNTSEADDLPLAAVRLRVQLFLRWLAIIGQTVAVLTVHIGFGFSLPLAACLMVIGLAVLLNFSLMTSFPANHILSRRETTAYLAYDIAQLGLLLYLTGGLINPFALLLLAPATISASLLNARTTFLLVLFTALIASLLAVVHEPLPWRGAPPEIPFLFRFGVWVALTLALAFIPSYVWRVSREGRRMTAALQATRSVLSREQRLSALDGLAAAAAHQLGTPLGTIVLVSGEMARRDDLPESMREDLTLMREQALRCRDILSSLSIEENDPVVSQISLRGLLDEAVLEAGETQEGIYLSCRANGLLATGEPQMPRHPELIYGLGNLIENAASFAKTSVWISATYSAQQVSIEIADDGPGFAADIISRLGEPYTSSRSATADANAFGLGLGFFIARTLIQRSGGRIDARNLKPNEVVNMATPGGACVRIIWPRKKLETRA